MFTVNLHLIQNSKHLSKLSPLIPSSNMIHTYTQKLRKYYGRLKQTGFGQFQDFIRFNTSICCEAKKDQVLDAIVYKHRGSWDVTRTCN